jgi:hypothetical protein
MEVFLYLNGILFKDREKYVKGVGERLSKDKAARRIAAGRGITEGDVCVLSALEMAPLLSVGACIW